MKNGQAITLVFPHQLFWPHPAVQPDRRVWLTEEFLFFRQYPFHQQKIVLHRASMKCYADRLQAKKIAVQYVEATEPEADVRHLMTALAGKQITEIHYADVADNWLEKRIRSSAAMLGIKLIKYPSPNFLNEPEEAGLFFEGRKSYFQTDFYTWQRKKRNLLLEPGGRPLGGKWTYDAENRKKLPRGEMIPPLKLPAGNKYVQEAVQYTERHFGNNYGKADGFCYPVTPEDAAAWLDDFLYNRFARFGLYEDAMAQKESYLFHSVLTPALNIGLLNPQQVIDKAITVAIDTGVPLNALEGFVRQVIGWREFIRIVYEREGSRQRTRNFWGFTRRIPASFWTGTTGIHPVDAVITRLLKTGYSHHIERLMVLGNFMLLCEFDPDEVYRWFMEMYIDSYDWVMVPNVYGMTQFADGGLMTTKPYISGSNYLLKMGDWNKGPWQEIWDGLFWRFMQVHRDFFSGNPRLSMLLGTWDKMPAGKRQAHLDIAEKFLEKLDHETKEESRPAIPHL